MARIGVGAFRFLANNAGSSLAAVAGIVSVASLIALSGINSIEKGAVASSNLARLVHIQSLKNMLQSAGGCALKNKAAGVTDVSQICSAGGVELLGLGEKLELMDLGEIEKDGYLGHDLYLRQLRLVKHPSRDCIVPGYCGRVDNLDSSEKRQGQMWLNLVVVVQGGEKSSVSYPIEIPMVARVEQDTAGGNFKIKECSTGFETAACTQMGGLFVYSGGKWSCSLAPVAASSPAGLPSYGGTYTERTLPGSTDLSCYVKNPLLLPQQYRRKKGFDPDGDGPMRAPTDNKMAGCECPCGYEPSPMLTLVPAKSYISRTYSCYAKKSNASRSLAAVADEVGSCTAGPAASNSSCGVTWEIDDPICLSPPCCEPNNLCCLWFSRGCGTPEGKDDPACTSLNISGSLPESCSCKCNQVTDSSGNCITNDLSEEKRACEQSRTEPWIAGFWKEEPCECKCPPNSEKVDGKCCLKEYVAQTSIGDDTKVCCESEAKPVLACNNDPDNSSCRAPSSGIQLCQGNPDLPANTCPDDGQLMCDGVCKCWDCSEGSPCPCDPETQCCQGATVKTDNNCPDGELLVSTRSPADAPPKGEFNTDCRCCPDGLEWSAEDNRCKCPIGETPPPCCSYTTKPTCDATSPRCKWSDDKNICLSNVSFEWNYCKGAGQCLDISQSYNGKTLNPTNMTDSHAVNNDIIEINVQPRSNDGTGESKTMFVAVVAKQGGEVLTTDLEYEWKWRLISTPYANVDQSMHKPSWSSGVNWLSYMCYGDIMTEYRRANGDVCSKPCRLIFNREGLYEVESTAKHTGPSGTTTVTKKFKFKCSDQQPKPPARYNSCQQLSCMDACNSQCNDGSENDNYWDDDSYEINDDIDCQTNCEEACNDANSCRCTTPARPGEGDDVCSAESKKCVFPRSSARDGWPVFTMPSVAKCSVCPAGQIKVNDECCREGYVSTDSSGDPISCCSQPVTGADHPKTCPEPCNSSTQCCDASTTPDTVKTSSDCSAGETLVAATGVWGDTCKCVRSECPACGQKKNADGTCEDVTALASPLENLDSNLQRNCIKNGGFWDTTLSPSVCITKSDATTKATGASIHLINVGTGDGRSCAVTSCEDSAVCNTNTKTNCNAAPPGSSKGLWFNMGDPTKRVQCSCACPVNTKQDSDEDCRMLGESECTTDRHHSLKWMGGGKCCTSEATSQGVCEVGGGTWTPDTTATSSCSTASAQTAVQGTCSCGTTPPEVVCRDFDIVSTCNSTGQPATSVTCVATEQDVQSSRINTPILGSCGMCSSVITTYKSNYSDYSSSPVASRRIQRTFNNVSFIRDCPSTFTCFERRTTTGQPCGNTPAPPGGGNNPVPCPTGQTRVSDNTCCEDSRVATDSSDTKICCPVGQPPQSDGTCGVVTPPPICTSPEQSCDDCSAEQILRKGSNDNCGTCIDYCEDSVWQDEGRCRASSLCEWDGSSCKFPSGEDTTKHKLCSNSPGGG